MTQACLDNFFHCSTGEIAEAAFKVTLLIMLLSLGLGLWAALCSMGYRGYRKLRGLR